MLGVEYALTSDRTMKALTGLTRPEFRALVPAFGQALYDQALQRDPPRQRRPGGGGPATLKTAAAKLFFILYICQMLPFIKSLRSKLTFAVLEREVTWATIFLWKSAFHIYIYVQKQCPSEVLFFHMTPRPVRGGSRIINLFCKVSI